MTIKNIWFPIKANSKIPDMKGWQKLTERVPLENHKGNVGFLTGKNSGITVVDIDAKDGGMEEWERLIAEHGDPSTTYQTTPSGGRHYFFQYEPTINQATKFNGVGIDTRNDGGMVLIQPSKIDGNRYVLYGDIKDAKEMPLWLKEWLMLDPKGHKKEEKEVPVDPFFLAEQVPRDKLSKYLACIDPDAGYEAWFSVLCAAMNIWGDDACNTVKDWSAKGSKYDGDRAFYRKWETLEKRDDGIGEATLCMLAKNGYPQLYKELFETVEFIDDDDDDPIDLRMCRDYRSLKSRFDRGVFKIEKPCMFYVKKTNGTVEIMSVKGLKDSFMDVIYTETDKKGNQIERSFVDRWLRDGTKRMYEYEEFDPSRTAGSHVFNTFEGFVAEEYEQTGDIAAIIDHFKLLFKDDYEYVLKWFANIIQNPTKKSCVSLILHSGTEGAGKTCLLNWLGRKVIGDTYYKITADPVNDLFGKFSTGVHNKLLFVLEEASGKDIRPNMDKLKDLITSFKARCEIKGMTAYDIKNHASFVVLTNNDNPVAIGYTDRRFCGFNCDNERAQDPTYFAPLIRAMEDDKVAGTFYYYLKSLDLSGMNFQQMRPMTEYYKEMQRINIPNWAKFLSWKVQNNEDDITSTGQELYLMYKNYCSYGGYEPLSSTMFSLKIKKYTMEEDAAEEKPIVKKRNKTGMKYKIRLDMLGEALKKDNLFDEDAM